MSVKYKIEIKKNVREKIKLSLIGGVKQILTQSQPSIVIPEEIYKKNATTLSVMGNFINIIRMDNIASDKNVPENLEFINDHLSDKDADVAKSSDAYNKETLTADEKEKMNTELKSNEEETEEIKLLKEYNNAESKEEFLVNLPMDELKIIGRAKEISIGNIKKDNLIKKILNSK